MLKNAINMPCKVRRARGPPALLHRCYRVNAERRCLRTKTPTRQYSRSEVMLTFFERSPLDQVLRNDKVHRIQPCFQSPVKISGQRLSGGGLGVAPADPGVQRHLLCLF